MSERARGIYLRNRYTLRYEMCRPAAGWRAKPDGEKVASIGISRHSDLDYRIHAVREIVSESGDTADWPDGARAGKDGKPSLQGTIKHLIEIGLREYGLSSDDV